MDAAEERESLWISTSDEALLRRAGQEMDDVGCTVRPMPQETIATSKFWKDCPRPPGAVLLDPGNDLDSASRVLHAIKRARAAVPAIVVANETDRDFGTKIVSLGVSYLLPRDFAPGELADVFASLVRLRRQRASRSPNAPQS